MILKCLKTDLGTGNDSAARVLLYKHECLDLHLGPQHWGGWGKVHREIHWSGSLAETESSRVS